MLTFLTDFGDQAVILPLLFGVAAVLAWYRRWRLLLCWGLAVPAVLGTVLVLKTMCYACLWRLPWLGPEGWGLRSPSGHTASSAVVYGCVAMLLLPRRPLGLAGAAGVAVAAAVLVGASRVLLGVHSLADVTVATSVSLAGVFAFGVLRAWLAGDAAPAPRWPTALVVLAVLLAFHGRHLSAEATIADAAQSWWRRLIVTACQPTV